MECAWDGARLGVLVDVCPQPDFGSYSMGLPRVLLLCDFAKVGSLHAISPLFHCRVLRVHVIYRTVRADTCQTRSLLLLQGSVRTAEIEN